MATHSSILAWEIPWTEEPGRLQSTGLQRVEHDWATNTFTKTSWKFRNRLKNVPSSQEAFDEAGCVELKGIHPQAHCGSFLGLCVCVCGWPCLAAVWYPNYRTSDGTPKWKCGVLTAGLPGKSLVVVLTQSLVCTSQWWVPSWRFLHENHLPGIGSCHLPQRFPCSWTLSDRGFLGFVLFQKTKTTVFLLFTISPFKKEDTPWFYNSCIFYMSFILWLCPKLYILNMAWIISYLRTKHKLCVFSICSDIQRSKVVVFFFF